MIPVAAALERALALVEPLGTEEVPLARAAGRILARTATAGRDQPPFAASAMDGYAVSATEIAAGQSWRVIGSAAAGHAFEGEIGEGEAVRIFTGAPLPGGGERVVIQEDVEVKNDGDTIVLKNDFDTAHHVRPAGSDFAAGFALPAPLRLGPAQLALLAAMNRPLVQVSRRPIVALIATGDELVMPGEDPGSDQIIASNCFGLKAMAEAAGATARLLPVARDNAAALNLAFDLAAGADLVVTIGGASVGDHDLVAGVAAARGMDRAFYKIAMRPGKPLMAGRIGDAVMLGLPGNPVSSMVCGHVFMLPMIRAMLGLGKGPAPRRQARLAADLAANGPREHYMRARLTAAGIAAMPRQDSALLSVLSEADALLIRPADDGPRKIGDIVEYLEI